MISYKFIVKVSFFRNLYLIFKNTNNFILWYILYAQMFNLFFCNGK